MHTHIIILDTEFTSWEGSQERNWSKSWEKKELVQLSAIKIRLSDFKITKKINIYIKPVNNPILSEYFINLTGITNNKISKDGISFRNAIKEFYNFSKKKNNKKINIYSYGNDYTIIKENLDYHNYSSKSKYRIWENNFFDIIPFLKKNNIKTDNYTSGTLYKFFYPNMKSMIHNAVWDVYSIYIVLKKLKFTI